MSLPVLNWVREVQGIPLYGDLDDPALFHVAPQAHWSQLTERILGTQLVAISGEVLFDLSVAERDALSVALPGFRFAPVQILGYTNELQCAANVSEPHSATVRLVESLPFPRVAFSCSLRRTAPTFQDVRDAIHRAWSARSVFSGRLMSAYVGRRAEIACVIRLARDAVDRALREVLPNTPFLRSTAVLSARDVVQRHAADWVRPIWGELDATPPTVLEFAASTVERVHLRTAGPSVVFDGGESVEGFVIRDVRECPAATIARLVKAPEERHDHRLLGTG